MSSPTPTKPSFLGLLNAISLAESRAGVYLSAWADVTPDKDLAECLRFVAARETSHGDVFCRRIGELGFSLLEREDPESEERLKRVSDPKLSDLEKIGPRSNGANADPFKDIEQQMDDGIFDPLTCSLMRWYIDEERDSGKLLEEAYACVRGDSPNGVGSETQALMECMTQGFDRLEKAIGMLAKS